MSQSPRSPSAPHTPDEIITGVSYPAEVHVHVYVHLYVDMYVHVTYVYKVLRYTMYMYI